jgi:hypothetical protein
MIAVKAGQKIFTYAEVANPTGICAEPLHNLAKRHRLGFFASAAESLGNQVEQWFFPPWDLIVLTTLFPRCAHERRILTASLQGAFRPAPTILVCCP